MTPHSTMIAEKMSANIILALSFVFWRKRASTIVWSKGKVGLDGKALVIRSFENYDRHASIASMSGV